MLEEGKPRTRSTYIAYLDLYNVVVVEVVVVSGIVSRARTVVVGPFTYVILSPQDTRRSIPASVSVDMTTILKANFIYQSFLGSHLLQE